jgi:hypothetical protein
VIAATGNVFERPRRRELTRAERKNQRSPVDGRGKSDSVSTTRNVHHMSNEFGLRSCAALRESTNDIWADAAMKFGVYSIAAAALLLVLIQCGHMLYHLSLMVW